MDPVLLSLLVFAAMFVAGVWLLLFVFTLAIRGVVGVLKLPVRIVRSVAAAPSAPLRPARPALAAQLQTATQCSNEKCLTALPPIARYCPRCGSAVRAQHDMARQRYGAAQARVA